MFRISVTTIEKFRRYMASESSYDTEENLLQSLRGEFHGNAKTRFGSAYEKLIENPVPFEVPNGYVVDGILFTHEHARPAIEFREEHPDMIIQIPATKIYQAGLYTVQLSGKFDAVEGLFCRDFKCKFKAIDWQEYYDSYQWRYYLSMLDLKVFYYDVFEVNGTEDPFSESIVDFIVKDCQSTYFTSYPQMEDDCQSLIYQFMNYIEEKNLFSLLRKVESPTITTK